MQCARLAPHPSQDTLQQGKERDPLLGCEATSPAHRHVATWLLLTQLIDAPAVRAHFAQWDTKACSEYPSCGLVMVASEKNHLHRSHNQCRQPPILRNGECRHDLR